MVAIEERKGEPEKAAAAYETIIKQNANDVQAILKLARLCAGPLNDPRKALTLAKSAHDIAPNEPRACALLGKLVYQSGDYPWAVSLLQVAAGQLTNQPAVLYDLAWAYYAAGRAAEADAKMEAAVAEGNSLPDLEDARQFLALRAAVKDPAQVRAAIAQAQSLLQKQPRYLPALMVSALLDEQQGAAKEAAGIYSQVLKDYPLFTPAMRQLAILYTQSGQDDAKAYDLAEKARGSLPDDLELKRALGILAFRRGDAVRSAGLLKASTGSVTNDGELLYYLGMDYYKLKQPKDCKQTLTNALALKLPDKLAAEARRVLAELK
jgi:tetratricopeptide (TPR) repeat protein